MKPQPAWEEKSGMRVLRLYGTDLNPDWPQVVLLALTAKQFKEFERDPLAFAEKYKLFPEQPLTALSHCTRPPHVKGIPGPTDQSRWIVAIPHPKSSTGSCAAAPQSIIGCKEGRNLC